MKTASLTGRAAVVSLALLFSFLVAWHLATRGIGATQHMDPEYAKLMGATATQGTSAMPGPLDVAASSGSTCADRFTTMDQTIKALVSSLPSRLRAC
jgi:hypothetical protein